MVRNNLFQATKVVTFFQSAKYFHTFFSSNSKFPPLAQACSLCPIQNSEFSFVTYSAAPARRLSFAQGSSHTRLCQLADFPSLILRSSFAQPSLKVRSRFAPAEGKVLFCEGDLPIAPTPHYCALPPSLLERGNGQGCYKVL